MRAYFVNSAKLHFIRSKYGSEEMFRQAAEEGGEFCQSTLKVIIAERGTTPVTPEEARTKVISEVADVLNTIDMLFDMGYITEDEVFVEKDKKLERWYERAQMYRRNVQDAQMNE